MITHEIKTSWKESLDNLEKQLVDSNRFAGETVDLGWINDILEDRKEEFNHLIHLSEVTLETITAFTENLQALDAELLEILTERNLTKMKQDREFVHPTRKNNSLTYQQDESNALLACNQSNRVTPWGFFKTQSCRENISIQVYNSRKGKAMTALK